MPKGIYERLPKGAPIEERFWAKVEKTETCWKWVRAKTSAGYGSISIDGKGMILAHRLSYEIHKGKIPDGLTIDHLCRNRACVNPDHLEAVTMKENLLRGSSPLAINARKVLCIHGHKLSGDNLYVPKSGKRQCRSCQRERSNKTRKD